MINLCFRVITMAIGLYFTGTMANPSRKSSVLFNSACQWNGYLLTNCSFTGKHDIPVDKAQTAATVDVSSNFLRVLLQSPTKKEWNIKHLDLSNKLISKITLSPLAHLHTLNLLNLSNNVIRCISLALPSPKSSLVKRHRSSLRNGLPFLKVLILQRNKLSGIPKGLWKLKSLQSLDLSFNKISQIGVSDFHNCLQLENLYLKSSKIFRIHPEAFQDLKKLQVIDLSNNALTSILPIMIIALELPHLDADLAHNQWQCDESTAVFQNFISGSWRKKWNVICKKSIRNQEAYWWTPKSKILRKTHIPHTNLDHMKSLQMSEAERRQEEMYIHFSTRGAKDHTSSGSAKQQRRPSRWVRSAREEQMAGGKEAASQDLALAVCLAVFITFFVAFCLGALTRPYVDRLWQQRCRSRGPRADNAYSNKGFYDDIEPVENLQHTRLALDQVCSDLTLGKNQGPFSGTAASPHAAVIADRTPGTCRKETGGQQRRQQCGDHTAAGSREDKLLQNDSAARCIHRQPNADNHALISAGLDPIYRNDILGERSYETVAQEDSLLERSVGIPALADRSHTGAGSIYRNSNALDPPLSREVTAAHSKTPHTKATRTGENEKRKGPERLPSEFSQETQASTSKEMLSTQQQRLEGASAEAELSTYYSPVTLSDPGGVDPYPRVCPPGWGHYLPGTHANREPMQNVSDTEHELDTNYDSDEGSLFTLSSVSSEDTRNGIEEEADGKESHRASEPPEDEDSGVRKDKVTSLESLEDLTFQKIQEKCENQEDHFEKPLISGPDSGLCESHLESASNTNEFEAPLPTPRSLGNSPSSDEIPGMFTYDHVTGPQSEATEWHCSLRDLQIFHVDILPQTPRPPEVPSDPDRSASRERESDIYTCDPFIQRTDTAQNSVLSEITKGENARPSQQDSEGCNVDLNPLNADANQGCVCPLEDYDSREVISQAQLLQVCSNELALQCERKGGDHLEEGPNTNATRASKSKQCTKNTGGLQ